MLILIFRAVFMVSGVIGGYQLMLSLRVYWRDDQTAWISALILTIFMLVGVGYVVGGVLGRWVDRLLERIEGSLQQYSAADILVAAFGLIVGLFIAALVSFPVSRIDFVGTYLSLLLFVILGYLGLRLSLRKREDLRTIPFLTSSSRAPEQSRVPAKLVDTSVIIDGRISDIAQTGFMQGVLIVPRFVLRELQDLADSEDALKRNRARRGLDVLKSLQEEPSVGVEIVEQDYADADGVDAKLVRLARELGVAIITNDYNLNKVATLEGVQVLNVNELANALRPVVLPGERIAVQIIREGKEAGQGIAYLDDGTMIVVDGGKRFIGEEIEVIVTSVLQTPAGRMIFARLEERQGATA